MDELLSPLVIIEYGCSVLVMKFCHHLILADTKVFMLDVLESQIKRDVIVIVTDF